MASRSTFGATTFGSSWLKEDEKTFFQDLIEDFENQIFVTTIKREIPRGFVRTNSRCLLYALLNKTHAFLLYKKTDAVVPTVYQGIRNGDFRLIDIQSHGRCELGLENNFAFKFDRAAISDGKSYLRGTSVVKSVAEAFVEQEYQRVLRESQLIRMSPVFGPANFVVRNDFCFVIGPFSGQPNETYSSIIKPAVESFNMVCHRANELFTNKAIMHDIWKSICEARIVIADLTGSNANEFYELGIAHTLGKETILLCSKEEETIPFDIQGIRQIRFENSPAGGKKLEQDLKATIASVLNPAFISLEISNDPDIPQ